MSHPTSVTPFEAPHRHPVLVTAVPEAGRVIVDYDTGSRRVIDYSYSKSAEKIVARLGTSLSRAAALGNGVEFTTPTLLPELTPSERISHTQALSRLAEIAHDVVEETPFVKPNLFRSHVANVAIRNATLGELAEYYHLATRQTPDASALEALKEQAEADEAYKKPLVEFDHAQIEVNGRRYILPLSEPTSFIACRTIECLSYAKKGEPITVKQLATDVYRALTIAERALLFDFSDEYELYLVTDDLKQEVRHVLEQLTSGMDLTTRFDADKYERAGEAYITYSKQPFQTLEPDNSRVALPPGTPRDLSHIQVTEAHHAEAAHFVNVLVSQTSLGSEEAIDFLSHIMSTSGKHAFFLAAAKARLAEEDLLARAHSHIMRFLNKSEYYTAVVSRRTAGAGFTNKTQHRARQTSGGRHLQATTTNPVFYYRRWTFFDQEQF